MRIRGETIFNELENHLIGHELAVFDILLGLLADCEWFFISSRSKSPVETWGTSRLILSKFASVPLPAPGGPNRTSLIAGPGFDRFS